MNQPMGSAFALVLHTHLPMVLNHGRWPHGSDWLCEAAFECYLPLLETAHRLVADGISPKWTINLSPILTEQLASPEFQKELSFYYENVRRACVESRAHFEGAGNKEIVRLASFWEEFYERMWEMHRRIGGDIPGTFAELQRGGHVEMITCAATHGYLPLLGRDESIHLQLRTAVETPRRHFGQAPRGIWLPECAYRPRYEWTPPTGRDSGRVRRVRPGIEELLARHGLEYFVADAHLVSAGDPVFLYRDFVPFKARRDEPATSVPGTEARSPYASYRVASRGGSGTAVAFFRDPKTTLQVWSRAHGYPGDYAYLEFHKKHFPGGLRFWRSTDNSGDLGRKIAYDPALAVQKVGLQARHFVELVTSTLAAARADGPAVAATRAAKGDLARALTQATRELLLLQASDWQFLITTGTARDYAERRVAEHYAEFKRLSEMARGLASGEPLSPDDANSLRRLEREDFCFPDLEPAWGMGPPRQG